MTGLAFHCSSSARTDVGCKRGLNEDAFIDCPQKRLWAVADGMGGHSAGDVASRMIVDALARLEPAPRLGTYVRRVLGCLQQVNTQLNAEAERRDTATIGATVAALVAGGSHCVYLWAGDSRVYLWRDDSLRQLTRDHSVLQELLEDGEFTDSEEALEQRADASHVTRAVGGDAALELAAEIVEILEGDVYIVCSDGLTKEIADREIEALLRLQPAAQAGRLVEEALSRGARDNVTVVSVTFDRR